MEDLFHIKQPKKSMDNQEHSLNPSSINIQASTLTQNNGVQGNSNSNNNYNTNNNIRNEGTFNHNHNHNNHNTNNNNNNNIDEDLNPGFRDWGNQQANRQFMNNLNNNPNFFVESTSNGQGNRGADTARYNSGRTNDQAWRPPRAGAVVNINPDHLGEAHTVCKRASVIKRPNKVYNRCYKILFGHLAIRCFIIRVKPTH